MVGQLQTPVVGILLKQSVMSAASADRFEIVGQPTPPVFSVAMSGSCRCFLFSLNKTDCSRIKSNKLTLQKVGRISLHD
uniref:Uncharacterized protein n=1 Tax=Setaria viridis TaxID=4556 RepID=A0A4U6VCH1_SETVI|nr:hypothetical protein SEVIR_3G125900v2 [Setaria viridis]